MNSGELCCSCLSRGTELNYSSLYWSTVQGNTWIFWNDKLIQTKYQSLLSRLVSVLKVHCYCSTWRVQSQTLSCRLIWITWPYFCDLRTNSIALIELNGMVRRTSFAFHFGECRNIKSSEQLSGLFFHEMFEQTKENFRWKKNGVQWHQTGDERYTSERCAMRKHQQATHLNAIEGAVVLDYEILALAHREEVAVLTQQVGHVDGFRCWSIREK